MLHTHFRGLAPIAGLLLGAGACATTMKPPVANSGPALSQDGVQVAVLRQACLQTQPVDEVPTGSVDETVEIEVRNGSPDPVTVRPDRIRLVGTDESVATPAAAPSGSELTVAAGETQTIQLRFSARNGLECTKEMRLDASDGITRRASPVALHPLPFRPL
jgi:hypothetical protein